MDRVIVQGSEAVDRNLEECESLVFDIVEVSSGLAPISIYSSIPRPILFMNSTSRLLFTNDLC